MENLKIVLLKVSVYIHSLAVFLLIAFIMVWNFGGVRYFAHICF